jgi:cytochrome b involved in lipid metabolism
MQWIIIDAKVYDVSRFQDLHPGGANVFLNEDIRASTSHLRYFLLLIRAK